MKKYMRDDPLNRKYYEELYSEFNKNNSNENSNIGSGSKVEKSMFQSTHNKTRIESSSQGKIIPKEAWLSSWGIKNILNNPAMVQLLHRFLAFTLVILVVRLFILSRRTVLKQSHQQPVNVLLGVVLLQFILGVITVLYQAPLFWSSVHQINAFVLFTTVILTIHRFSARAAS